LRAIGGEQANVVPRDRQVAEELRLGADVDSVAAAAAGFASPPFSTTNLAI
jgi:hypothetical protein